MLSTSPGTDIKQFGIGLSAGVIFDATVIRALLVPSLMTLLGALELVVPPARRPVALHDAATHARSRRRLTVSTRPCRLTVPPRRSWDEAPRPPKDDDPR